MTRRKVIGLEAGLIAAIRDARAECDEYVIVEALPYFVQLMPNFGALYGEVVSNAYLEQADHLNPFQARRLIALGWTAPENPCHPNCPRTDHPNFTCLWHSTTSSHEIARDLLEGLMVVTSARGEVGPNLRVKVGARVTRPTSGPIPGH